MSIALKERQVCQRSRAAGRRAWSICSLSGYSTQKPFRLYRGNRATVKEQERVTHRLLPPRYAWRRWEVEAAAMALAGNQGGCQRVPLVRPTGRPRA